MSTVSPGLLVGISFAVALPVGALLFAVCWRIIDPPAERGLHRRVAELEKEVSRLDRAMAQSPDPVLQALARHPRQPAVTESGR